MHLFQLEIITINFHAFYITKNGTLLCDVTMTLIRQEKIGNIFFLKQHTCFLKKMNINHFYPKMHTAAQISTKRPALLLDKALPIMTTTLNKEWGHIGFGFCVHPSVRPWIRSSQLMHAISYEQCMLGF